MGKAHATVSVAKMKDHLSDCIAKSVHGGSRIVITKRSRPVAALVSMDDLATLERDEERIGLSEVIGKWKGFSEIKPFVEESYSSRRKDGSGRDVSL